MLGWSTVIFLLLLAFLFLLWFLALLFLAAITLDLVFEDNVDGDLVILLKVARDWDLDD